MRIVAREGDVAFEDPEGLAFLSMPKAARIIAGRDIRDIGYEGQNLSEHDVTVLHAGRDITYSTVRGDDNRLTASSREIVIDGQGTLQLAAGRNIDLQTSSGVSTRGNLDNPFLPEGGADISVLAGLGERAAEFIAFAERYLQHDESASGDPIAYVESITGEEDLSREQALEKSGSRSSLLTA